MAVWADTGRWRGLMGCVCLAVMAAGPVSAATVIDFSAPGASEDLTRVLRSASSLLAAERDDRTDSEDLFAAARAEYAALIAALYASAYYSPVIHVRVDGREAADIAPLDAPKAIRRIAVTVEPGPGFVFSRAEVSPLAPGTVLPKAFAIGQPAETGVIRTAVKDAIDGWRAEGHAKAAPGEQSLTVRHAEAQLDAAIRMAPGPRLRFGRFDITGQDRMREDRIRAIAGFPQGEVFSPEKLRRSADRLRRSGAFRSVSVVEADTAGADGTLDVATTLVEDLPRHYGYGAEVSSLDGLNLSANWMHRNLFGGAERLRFDGSVENIGARDNGVDYRLGVTLERPATFGPDTLLSTNASVARLNEPEELIDVARIGVTVTQFVSDRLTLRGGMAYQAQNVTDATGYYEFRNLAFPLGLTMDARDNKFDATRGYFLAAELTPFLGFQDTDSGARLTVDARAYHGFGSARPVVFAGRFQLGSIFGAALEQTPRDYLFYSGGGGTVRGQPFQSLGVNVLADNQLTGGSRFLGASAEIRAMVTDKIGLVGFYDVGSVGVNDFIDDPEGGWQSGAGIGVRYATGFGPIRVDIAAPVGGDTGDGVILYVGIGQAF